MATVHISRLITATRVTFTALTPEAKRLISEVYGAPTKVFELPAERQAVIQFQSWAVGAGLGLAEDVNDPQSSA
jgi:hypothetical protein